MTFMPASISQPRGSRKPDAPCAVDTRPGGAAHGYTASVHQLDLPERTPDHSVGALSVDAKWIADKLSQYGFQMADLEALYPAAETVANEWDARGDELISIDLVTGEMRRRFGLKFSNTVRPFLARMLRDRRPSLREKIEVTTTSRGRNRNVKVAIDHLDVVAVIHRAADGSEQRVELADVPAVVERIKAAQKQNKRPRSASSPK
jgi:hypothetical protein